MSPPLKFPEDSAIGKAAKALPLNTSEVLQDSIHIMKRTINRCSIDTEEKSIQGKRKDRKVIYTTVVGKIIPLPLVFASAEIMDFE